MIPGDADSLFFLLEDDSKALKREYDWLAWTRPLDLRNEVLKVNIFPRDLPRLFQRFYH